MPRIKDKIQSTNEFDNIFGKLNTHTAQTLKAMTVEELSTAIAAASSAYYNTSTPLVSDDVFDLMVDHLRKLAPEHPVLQQIGAPIQSTDKVTLPYWMGSLNKIRDDQNSIDKWCHIYPGDVVVSDKLDGNSALLVVEHDRSMLYSRGNGTQGKNISAVVPYIKTIPTPSDLDKGKRKLIRLALRGELIISKSSWEEIKSVGANARNVVAGNLNKKIPDPEIAAKIEFVAYELIHPKMKPSDGLALLKELGFTVVNHTVMNATTAMKEKTLSMEDLSRVLMDRRTSSPYEIDGIVVWHDQEHQLAVGKNPKYAFAFKSIHTHSEAEVIVTDIEWKTSKDGYMKPTVLFNPVSLGGVTINRATGFNAAFINSNLLGAGARIVIIRSGDVIPHIQRVLTPSATGKPSFPDVAYAWNESRVDIVTSDAHNSTDVSKRTIEHFAKKLSMDGVGPGVISKIVDAHTVTMPMTVVDATPADAIVAFMRTTKADLLKIAGFQEKSAERVLAAIQKVKNTASCTDIMAACNVFGRGFGDRKIQTIVKAHPEILNKVIPSVDNITKVEGIGHITAKVFCDGLPSFFSLADRIGIRCGTEPTVSAAASASAASSSAPAPAKTTFSGMTIVFSGFRNKEWEHVIEAHGGKVSSSVSKNTTRVVSSNPDDATGKVKKARELGIKLISVEEFEKLLHSQVISM